MWKVEDFGTLKKDVRSLLISSKLGLSPEQLRRDYAGMLGYPMPLKQLGFRNIMDMAKEMPDVVSIHFRDNGELYLKAVSDDTTSKIEELVSKQRTSKTDQRKRHSPAGHYNRPPIYYKSSPVPLPRRGCAPPALHGQLRAKLRILLSQGPIRLSDLDQCFLRCFGEPLLVFRYGFFSTTEMLLAASDLIVIQQSRLGSVVSLREVLPPPRPLTVPCATTKRTGPVKPKPPVVEQPAPKPPERSAQTAATMTGSSSVCHEPKKDEMNQEAEEYGLFEECVQKLELELRQRIVENGVAGTISQELKDKLRKIVRANCGGISVHNLPAEYKRVYGEELPLRQSGFVSVTELVGALTDTFHLKPAEGSDGQQSLIVMDSQDMEGAQSDSKETENLVEDTFRSYYLSGGQSPWEDKLGDEVAEENPVEACKTYKTQGIPLPQMYPVIHVYPSCAGPLDAIRSESLTPPRLRPAEEVFLVHVEQVESPGLFYIHVGIYEDVKALEDMLHEMRRCYTAPKVSERYALPQRFVRRGQVCCVSLCGMWFHRVVIHQVLSPTRVEVYLVDYGGKTVVQSSDLKFLKSCYGVLPAQAVPSSLAGIQPTNGVWTAEATATFQKLCSNRTLLGVACRYTGDVLQLYLCDSNTGDDFVHAALLSQGHGTLQGPAFSAACVQANPVTLYMGERKLDLPELEEETMTCPEHVDTSAEDEEDEMPPLALIYDYMAQPQETQVATTFRALPTDPGVSELARAVSDEAPTTKSTSSQTTSSLIPPDVIQTKKNQGHCAADSRTSSSAPPTTSSVILGTSCPTAPPPPPEPQPKVPSPPAILRTFTPVLGLFNNWSQGSAVSLRHMRYSMFPLFGMRKPLSS